MSSSGLKSDRSGLSKVWKVEKRHAPSYTGGKLQFSTDETFFACMYGTNVSFVDMKTGALRDRLYADDDEVRLVRVALAFL